MPRPVVDRPNEGAVPLRVFFRLLRKNGDEEVEHLDIRELRPPSDVVNLSFPPPIQNRPERIGMVVDIEPVADIGSSAVDGKRFSREAVDDHKRDELLGKLAGAVVVAAMGKGRRKAVGARVGADEMVGGRFGGRIGGIGAVGRVFVESAALSERAVDLIGGDMVEMDVGKFPDGLEEREGPLDIRFDKREGRSDASIDVRLCGEMDDRVDLFFKELFDEGLIADISLDEPIPGMLVESGQILKVGRIGEKIEVEDAAAEGRGAKEMADEGRSDESRPAGYEEPLAHKNSFRASCQGRIGVLRTCSIFDVSKTE